MNPNEILFEQAKKWIPGGVSSPVRAFKSVGGTPLFFTDGHGSRVRDAGGMEYIDCVSSWGPLILGHAHPEVVEAVTAAARRGTSFGAPTERETRLAEMVVKMVPGIDKVRLVNSGTEAAMSALRLARGFTGRDKIIKFEGCYHGHADSFLIEAGSGALTFGQPSSPGVPASISDDTLIAGFNDLESVRRLFERHPVDIAALIVEPVPGNMGVILPGEGFLAGLRELASVHGALLIFDEVITGFRLAPGGAQEYFGVTPDITLLGKILGGGLPVGAFGGKAEIMDHLAPDGPVYQAGTLSGNPIATAAGAATLEILLGDDPYPTLEERGRRLFTGLAAAAEKAGIDTTVNFTGSMGALFFNPCPVENYRDAVSSDAGLYAKFHRNMLDRWVYLAPSAFETCFVSAAHADEDIDTILAAAAESLSAI